MHAAPSPRPTDAATAAAARARQQAFAAKLAGPKRIGTPMPGRIGTPVPGTALPGAAPRGATPAKAFEALRRPSSPGMPAVDPQAAVEALRRRYEESVAQSRGTTQSRGLAQAAQAAASKTQQQAEAIAKAKDAEGKQDYADAGTHWAHAFDFVPAGDTAHRASICFRRGGDLRRAARYGDEAVKLDPHKASYHLNLALVYADLGMGLRARGEIERAQAIDPQSTQVKEAILRIKAMK
jgi:tetratricopeptide (TPR) repeat protein